MKIEKNVPMIFHGKYILPTLQQIQGMEIGDSFLVKDCHSRALISSRLVALRFKTGHKYISSRIGNDLRIWRKA